MSDVNAPVDSKSDKRTKVKDLFYIVLLILGSIVVLGIGCLCMWYYVPLGMLYSIILAIVLQVVQDKLEKEEEHETNN